MTPTTLNRGATQKDGGKRAKTLRLAVAKEQ